MIASNFLRNILVLTLPTKYSYNRSNINMQNQTVLKPNKKIDKLLVCMGAQKAGTTWLHEVLANDERLKMPLLVKEVQYFNYLFTNAPLINQWRASWLNRLAKQPGFSNTLANYLQHGHRNGLLADNNKKLFRKIAFCLRPLNDEWYCDYMAIGPKKIWAVDISPEYALIGQVGFEHINTITNDLKLVFILRDPIERSWSGMIQEIKNKPDAGELLNRMANASVEDLVERAKKPNIQNRSNYLTTFKAIKAAGLMDCLKVVFYDDIVNKPSSVIDAIYEHIGINTPVVKNTDITKVVHKSPSLVMPNQFATQMQVVYAPMLAEIDKNFVTVPSSWKKRYEI